MKPLDRFSLIIMTAALFVIVFVLTSCKSINEAPIHYLYVIDVQHDKCSIRKITDKETLSSIIIEEVSLKSCDGVVGLNMQEFLNLRTYLKGKK